MNSRDMTPYEMLARISSMFALPSISGDDQVGVACPFCPPDPENGMRYVHLVSARTYPGTDNPAAAHSPHAFTKTDIKGDVTILRFFCEEQHHTWALVFAGERGETKVELVPIEESAAEGELPANVVRFAQRGKRGQPGTEDESK
ncbi:MAG TPA: hypothetical protein VF120_01230 [Ktedonobacterales bacterium]